MAGVLFIMGRFSIWDTDVDRIVNAIVEDLRKFTHIPAVVLIAAKTATLSPVEPRTREDGRCIDIDYIVEPLLMERVLIIKNGSCRLPFDCDILRQMFAEPGSKTPNFKPKR